MAQEYENLLCRWLDEVWNQRRSETIDELFVKDGQGYGLGTSQSISRPTNKKVEFTGMCIVRVSDGKIREAWNNFDFMTMYQQLGVF